jgi:hypothetical protein
VWWWGEEAGLVYFSSMLSVQLMLGVYLSVCVATPSVCTCIHVLCLPVSLVSCLIRVGDGLCAADVKS